MAIKPNLSVNTIEQAHNVLDLFAAGYTPAQVRLYLWRVFLFKASSSVLVNDPEMIILAEEFDKIIGSLDNTFALFKKEATNG